MDFMIIFGRKDMGVRGMGRQESTAAEIFRFKQFGVDQTGCAMKINTDGVLLGAVAAKDQSPSPAKILDIGTGTGVIALMLAQRFPHGQIDAIDIDPTAAARAGENFAASAFASRLQIFHGDFQFFPPLNSTNPTANKYDLIVSNPPFFIDALKNPDERKRQARHADREFFRNLLEKCAHGLSEGGCLQLILPPLLATEIEHDAKTTYGLYLAAKMNIYSFAQDPRPMRNIISLQRGNGAASPVESLVIYAERGLYSPQYKSLLSDFFLAF